MRTQRAGFTLVELLLVMLLGALVMGAVVQSLIIQQRTYSATGEMARSQDAIRIALGVLESELREVATSGPGLDQPDIVLATADSIVVRVPRTLGFACGVDNANRRLTAWSLNPVDVFNANNADGLFIFEDSDIDRSDDDSWIVTDGFTTQAPTQACPGLPATATAQRINLPNASANFLRDVRVGAPIRAYKLVTYGLFERNDSWILARRDAPGDPLLPLVARLAGQGDGLVFNYLDAAGDPITSNPVPPATVAAIEITARTGPRPGSGARAVTLTTSTFLRNN